ncbi:MAG: hypothetical protein ABSA78_03990 [Candidatus Sulfotelmatobacter sp.]
MTAYPVREPAVAGRFYPREEEALRAEVRNYLSQIPEQQPAAACIPDTWQGPSLLG